MSAEREAGGRDREVDLFPDRELEGVEVGRRVRLPRGAEPPIKVFVNGVEQQPGRDYDLRRTEVVFRRPIVKEGKVSGVRWIAMLMGLFGTYRKHEQIDVEYRLAGRIKLLADAPVEADD
jgi:hypothetical protein